MKSSFIWSFEIVLKYVCDGNLYCIATFMCCVYCPLPSPNRSLLLIYLSIFVCLANVVVYTQEEYYALKDVLFIYIVLFVKKISYLQGWENNKNKWCLIIRIRLRRNMTGISCIRYSPVFRESNLFAEHLASVGRRQLEWQNWSIFWNHCSSG